MESVIAVLPAHVVDQIAAGEVIERPASVVKELVDNSLDAGARTITVETQAGGRSLIRVVDDGRGMSPRDATLAFERHATSKLRGIDDLWALVTMGFRGEALPSIASVARVTLTTRREGDLAATRVQIEGGRVIGVSEAGAPVGTCVEVADLLYNVPARLKFLKGETTEASHITDFVSKIALAYPGHHIRLRHNGRVALDAPPDRDGFARANALLGTRVGSRMVPVSGEEAGFRITAFLGAPELAQTTARGVQLFVGRRPVRDRNLLHAVAMGYGELVPRGRYPLAIVMLDAPVGSVDYNVHPQKSEVRFADAGAVAAAVRHVVQAGIARAPWRDELGGAGPVMMTAIASVAPPRLPLDAPATQLAANYARDLRNLRGTRDLRGARDVGDAGQGLLGFDDGSRASSPAAVESPAGAGPRAWAQQIRDRSRASRAAEAEQAALAAAAFAQADRERQGELARRAAVDAPAASGNAVPWDDAGLAEGSAPAPTPGYFASLRFLGQLDLTYLVCESDGELVLIDQHVAHERVELARLLAAHGERSIPTQRLLFPTTLDVKPALVELATSVTDVLAQVGYEVEGFGKATLAIKAVPAGIRHGDPAQLLRKLLTEWAEHDGDASARERIEHVLGTIACHSVVRAGDRLSPSEAEALLRGMDSADFRGPGPHNRPVMLRLSLADIARRFGR